jgi:hypothetical protein
MNTDNGISVVTTADPGADSIYRIDGLGNRALNVLGINHIRSLKQLASLDATYLCSLRNAGSTTFQELGRGLLKLGIRPNWLQEIATGFSYELWSDDGGLATLDAARQAGWEIVAGPYDKDEYWMLEGALASLERNDTQYILCREAPESGISVLRMGMVAVEPEEKETSVTA